MLVLYQTRHASCFILQYLKLVNDLSGNSNVGGYLYTCPLPDFYKNTHTLGNHPTTTTNATTRDSPNTGAMMQETRETENVYKIVFPTDVPRI